MAAAYSNDLRVRVLKDADAGLTSKELAERDHVRRAWVDALKQRRRETGAFAARPQTVDPEFREAIADERAAHDSAAVGVHKPSRRSSAPSSPAWQVSACVTIRRRYSVVNRRRWSFAGTSGSGSGARDVAISISTTALGIRCIHSTLPALP